MRIVVVGAGAMGSLMAARLTLAGNEVTLFGRPSAHLLAIQERGLTVVEQDGERVVVPLRATSDPSAAADAELVVVLVKAYATAEAVAPLRNVLPREAVVLTLQNGLGNLAALRAGLRRDNGSRPEIILGVTTQAALRTSPGETHHTGDGITAIGRRHGAADAGLAEIARVLSAAGWSTIAVDDVHRWVWRKLAVNAAINPLTALAGVANRAISDQPDLKAAAETIVDEVVAVANRRGLSLDAADVAIMVDEVARATGENRSSMLIDLVEGRRTEIDAINGAVVAEAARLELPAPANQVVTALIRAQEGGDESATEEEHTV